ncbi:MAG: cbb3-type cytochrome oxidase assembly protein CcoS [Gemmatimonadetes bacterium]|nr:cbb3-type cytochrome oxidase assembly protein CcoS [Gemmatimonadota bacterium]MBK7594027.1 cbb3-type cytochrome oxidase assembly protein CcoS [Gemmatimonadota bacterium]MBL0179322.1 cbb3-type cytochrome oxidase assembly protein CcoS [Gemmatimonadota bacterium]MBP9899411.1 cbb3-type cytochrome oxidase assembly protein CcoS [Gemmatimonadales bacterium]
MSVLFLILPLALVLVGVAVWAYIWSARGGQFDDLDTPAVRLLHDDGESRVNDVRAVSRSSADPSSTAAPR